MDNEMLHKALTSENIFSEVVGKYIYELLQSIAKRDTELAETTAREIIDKQFDFTAFIKSKVDEAKKTAIGGTGVLYGPAVFIDAEKFLCLVPTDNEREVAELAVAEKYGGGIAVTVTTPHTLQQSSVVDELDFDSLFG